MAAEAVEDAPVEEAPAAPEAEAVEAPEAPEVEAAEVEAAVVQAPEDQDPEVDEFGEGAEAGRCFWFVWFDLYYFLNDVWVFLEVQ